VLFHVLTATAGSLKPLYDLQTYCTSDWSLDALLLFGGVFTAQLFLPGLQSFSRKFGLKKCAKEESISRFGKTGDSKSGKSSNANPFSGSIGQQKRLNQK